MEIIDWLFKDSTSGTVEEVQTVAGIQDVGAGHPGLTAGGQHFIRLKRVKGFRVEVKALEQGAERRTEDDVADVVAVGAVELVGDEVPTRGAHDRVGGGEAVRRHRQDQPGHGCPA